MGQPSQAGTYTFTVQVTDANSQVATKPFTLAVAYQELWEATWTAWWEYAFAGEGNYWPLGPFTWTSQGAGQWVLTKVLQLPEGPGDLL